MKLINIRNFKPSTILLGVAFPALLALAGCGHHRQPPVIVADPSAPAAVAGKSDIATMQTLSGAQRRSYAIAHQGELMSGMAKDPALKQQFIQAMQQPGK